MPLNFEGMPSVPFEELASKLSYYDSFSKDLLKAAKSKKKKKINSIMMLLDFIYEKIKPEKSAKPKQNIVFLGVFEYKKD